MACATPATRPATASGGQNVVIDVPGSATSRLVIRNDPDAASVLLAVPAGRTWAALSTAYSALNIPIVGFDSTTHTITGATSAFREFLRSPVSRFVDCGSTLV